MTDKVELIWKKVERLYDEAANDDDSRHYLGEILSFIDSILKETVSEDLEEASRRYVTPPNALGIRTFKAGAQWKGQQMMAKAVDGEVTYGKSLAIPSLGYFLDKNGLDFGDKVKVIIIKENKDE